MKYALDGHRTDAHPESWVAPNATLIGRVRLERNASVWWNAVLRADNDPITVGENSNVQDGSVLHTEKDCPVVIGRNVTVGHMAMLHGCTIGDNSLIGIGAVILDRARIGRNCIVAAKALVPEGRDIPDNSLVVGAPGRIARALTPENLALIEWSWDFYVKNWRRYRDGLQADE